jgi:hypothetical protein
MQPDSLLRFKFKRVLWEAAFSKLRAMPAASAGVKIWRLYGYETNMNKIETNHD